MALYAFDGTWNEAKTTEDPDYRHTNVVRFFNAYAKNTAADSNFYVAGVGTRFDAIGRALGGVFVVIRKHQSSVARVTLGVSR